MAFIWLLIFIASLAVLVKSADWVVESAEKIGLALKLSPFVVGVSIVALGTSFPEVAATVTATLKGNTEFVVDTAFGSNIATILLIVGVSAVIAKTLIVKRSLIDLDAPLLSVSTIMIAFIVWDMKVTFWEGVLLLLGFLVYAGYMAFDREGREEKKESEKEKLEQLPFREKRRKVKSLEKEKAKKTKKKISFKTFILLFLGIIGLAFGANYIVESVENLSLIFGISASFITITAVAIGTSLPELVVSIKAAFKKKYELALGNVFGSNVFTIFLIIGIPALIKPLKVNQTTLYIGLPYLFVSTFLFVVSGISRKIHIWEGLMYLLIFVLFIIQFFGAS